MRQGVRTGSGRERPRRSGRPQPSGQPSCPAALQSSHVRESRDCKQSLLDTGSHGCNRGTCSAMWDSLPRLRGRGGPPWRNRELGASGDVEPDWIEPFPGFVLFGGFNALPRSPRRYQRLDLSCGACLRLPCLLLWSGASPLSRAGMLARPRPKAAKRHPSAIAQTRKGSSQVSTWRVLAMYRGRTHGPALVQPGPTTSCPTVY
ncbi:uncharacterized protein VTP21DRAFT_1066 [Calcarisporiella thermophila]|uniref:uncharacterized protein n=1 Tax=Calcarisporiella thermophila TaxID=911321 RepID=UPI00374408D3